MRVGGVEQVLEREEVDVVQRDQEDSAPAPHEDEDRQDRMCPRRSRLRRLGETRGPSTFRAEAGRLTRASRTTSSGRKGAFPAWASGASEELGAGSSIEGGLAEER